MSVADPLRASARRRPGAAAVERAADADGEDGGKEGTGPGPAALSYGELDRAADRVARAVADAGAGPGHRVAALLPPSPLAVAVLHGVPRSGAALAPLPLRWTEAEARAYLARLDPALLVAAPGGVERLRLVAGEREVLPLDGVVEGTSSGTPEGRAAPAGATLAGGPPGGESDSDPGPGVDAEPGTAPAAPSLPAADPSRDHAILATSGTTGRPRAVRLTLANLLASARASVERMALEADDAWLASLPLAHVGGVAMVVRAAAVGCRLVLPAPGDGFEAGRFLRDVEAGGVTHASLVPTMLRRLLASPGGGTAPASLRGVLLGGAAAPTALVERGLEAGYPLYPTYGLTEAASQVATAPPGLARRKPGSAGPPLSGVEVEISPEGEILVRGPTVSPGYLAPAAPEAREMGGPRGSPSAGRGGSSGRSEGPAAGPSGREADDPGAPLRGPARRADGWLHTGDAGRLDADGHLHVTGRLSDRIVTGGETVDPEEVASVLRSHPAVREAAVVGVPDEEWGERVAAAVVPEGEASPEPAALRDACRDRLAGPKLPRLFRFVEGLPRSAHGKVDREAVRALFREES